MTYPVAIPAPNMTFPFMELPFLGRPGILPRTTLCSRPHPGSQSPHGCQSQLSAAGRTPAASHLTAATSKRRRFRRSSVSVGDS
jgi:hypothetical protein